MKNCRMSIVSSVFAWYRVMLNLQVKYRNSEFSFIFFLRELCSLTMKNNRKGVFTGFLLILLFCSSTDVKPQNIRLLTCFTALFVVFTSISRTFWKTCFFIIKLLPIEKVRKRLWTIYYNVGNFSWQFWQTRKLKRVVERERCGQERLLNVQSITFKDDGLWTFKYPLHHCEGEGVATLKDPLQ